MSNSVCSLFQEIASYVWHEIAKNNRRGNYLDERGISKHSVISRIQDYVEKTGSKKVFAQTAELESERGGDIELYLELKEDQYIRLLLQAKILKRDGKYHDVDHRVKSSQKLQWDLLNEYSIAAECKVMYLFFNGISDYRYHGNDCAGSFTEEQYGCAIAEVETVKNYCLVHNTGRLPFEINTTPPVGVPWRCIPCCSDNWDMEKYRYYSSSEIDMDEAFEEIFRDQTLGFLTQDDFLKRNDARRMHQNLSAKGWQPSGRVVISATDSHPDGTEIHVLG